MSMNANHFRVVLLDSQGKAAAVCASPLSLFDAWDAHRLLTTIGHHAVVAPDCRALRALADPDFVVNVQELVVAAPPLVGEPQVNPDPAPALNPDPNSGAGAGARSGAGCPQPPEVQITLGGALGGSLALLLPLCVQLLHKLLRVAFGRRRAERMLVVGKLAAAEESCRGK